jgi:hypothetical protein
MDCFASLAMTILQSFAPCCLKLNPIWPVPKAGRPSPLPLWERHRPRSRPFLEKNAEAKLRLRRIVRCDPGEGLRTIDRPKPLTPTLESELRSSRSHKGRGSSPAMPEHRRFTSGGLLHRACHWSPFTPPSALAHSSDALSSPGGARRGGPGPIAWPMHGLSLRLSGFA